MAQAAAGPLFKEWTLPRNSISAQRDHNWSRRRPYPLFTPRGARGPRSLLDMVTNVVANNIGDVTMEHMEATPTRLLWHIWHFLEARWVGAISIGLMSPDYPCFNMLTGEAEAYACTHGSFSRSFYFERRRRRRLDYTTLGSTYVALKGIFCASQNP